MSREPVSASRLTSLLSCPRKHYYRYELGLRRVNDDAAPLRFGTAWHAAMEARWLGGDYAKCLLKSLSVGTDLLDEQQVATISGLLRGYCAHYADEPLRDVKPECQFSYDLDGSRTFCAAGKIDGLATLADGRTALVEHKTTSEDISAGSDYWLRVRFSMQLLTYVAAARASGWPIETVVYDVTRKPSIRIKKDETPEAYSERLAADCAERPEFYFARREVAILDADIAEFEAQRRVLCFNILNYRTTQKRCAKPEHAWPRNVVLFQCRSCEFASFCLSNLSVNKDAPPSGFAVVAPNEELEAAKESP